MELFTNELSGIIKDLVSHLLFCKSINFSLTNLFDCVGNLCLWGSEEKRKSSIVVRSFLKMLLHDLTKSTFMMATGYKYCYRNTNFL